MPATITRKKFSGMQKRGFSLIEMIIYLSIMAMIMIVVVNTLAVIIVSQKRIGSLRIIEHSSIVFLDRLIREIREATSVDLVESVFDVHPGKLVLNTEDEDGNLQSIEFYLTDEILTFESPDFSGSLSDTEARVSSLIFRLASVDDKNFVKVELSIEAGEAQAEKSEMFYAGAMVREF